MFCQIIAQKRNKKKQNRGNKIISRNMFSMKNKIQVIPLSRNPRDKYIHVCVCFCFSFIVVHFFSLFVRCFHSFHVFSVLFISFHYFSCLFISFHFFSLLFMSFHFCSFLFINFLHIPSLEKTITNPDHLHVDPLSFADMVFPKTIHQPGPSANRPPSCRSALEGVFLHHATLLASHLVSCHELSAALARTKQRPIEPQQLPQSTECGLPGNVSGPKTLDACFQNFSTISKNLKEVK